MKEGSQCGEKRDLPPSLAVVCQGHWGAEKGPWQQNRLWLFRKSIQRSLPVGQCPPDCPKQKRELRDHAPSNLFYSISPNLILSY